jgi:hypothetical protein
MPRASAAGGLAPSQVLQLSAELTGSAAAVNNVSTLLRVLSAPSDEARAPARVLTSHAG